MWARGSQLSRKAQGRAGTFRESPTVAFETHGSGLSSRAPGGRYLEPRGNLEADLYPLTSIVNAHTRKCPWAPLALC